MSAESPKGYYEYLLQRSLLGKIYRRFFLYPRLCSWLSGRVLDVGCGIGDFLAYHGDAVGVDINSHCVDHCLDNGLQACVMEEDHLPFGDGEYDTVVLDNVLEHLADPAPLLGEIRRVLRPGGAVVLGVPGEKGYASDADHKVFYDEQLLTGTMGPLGFGVAGVFCMPFRSGYLSRRMRQYSLYMRFVKSG